MKEYNELKQAVIQMYRTKIGSKLGVQLRRLESEGKNKWTGNEIADEIEKNTEFGQNQMKSLMALTVDLISRQRLMIEPEARLDFWYESNACWGRIRNLYDLIEKAKLQLAEPNGIDTLDDFLDGSLQNGDIADYGTRREHKGESLRVYLTRLGHLENFVELFAESNK